MQKRQIGEIVEAKVVKILPSGVIVHFGEKESGFVHISEVSEKFVTDIRDFLKPDQVVKAEIVEFKKDKTFLSIKKVNKNYKKPKKKENVDVAVEFEDKLKNFLKDSSEKLKQLQNSIDRKRGVKKRPNNKKQ